jgi:hypothetical protein
MDSLMRELVAQGLTDKVMFFPFVHDFRGAKHGINEAHKQIISYAKVAGFDEVIVLEDDVRFCGEGAFDYFLQNKPEDYDIYLSGVYVSISSEDGTLKSFSGLHCYMVHSRYYDTFLKTPQDEHIDQAQDGKGKFVVCEPYAAIQHNGFSHNTGKVEVYDSLLEGRKFYNDFVL